MKVQALDAIQCSSSVRHEVSVQIGENIFRSGVSYKDLSRYHANSDYDPTITQPQIDKIRGENGNEMDKLKRIELGVLIL